MEHRKHRDSIITRGFHESPAIAFSARLNFCLLQAIALLRSPQSPIIGRLRHNPLQRFCHSILHVSRMASSAATRIGSGYRLQQSLWNPQEASGAPATSQKTSYRQEPGSSRWPLSIPGNGHARRCVCAAQNDAYALRTANLDHFLVRSGHTVCPVVRPSFGVRDVLSLWRGYSIAGQTVPRALHARCTVPRTSSGLGMRTRVPARGRLSTSLSLSSCATPGQRAGDSFRIPLPTVAPTLLRRA